MLRPQKVGASLCHDSVALCRYITDQIASDRSIDRSAVISESVNVVLCPPQHAHAITIIPAAAA